jgi:phosphomannomutase
MPSPIFTISGLRGIVGENLTPELVTTTCAGFGAYSRGRKIALGRDCRSSGEMLTAAALRGLLSSGCDVLDLGICPTPTVVAVVTERKLSGGIMITASHNPPEWNGLKFIAAAGRFLNDEELKGFKLVFRESSKAQKPKGPKAQRLKPGSITRVANAWELHIRRVLMSKLFPRPRRRLRIGVDACNGAASIAAMKTIEALGSVPFGLYCDPEQGSRFPRAPEPTADHLQDLSRFVRRHKLDLGVAFDPDGDRFSCVDENGVPLGEEATVMLAADFVLRKSPGPVVVNMSTTQGVEEIAGRYDVPVFRSRVGEAAVVAMMNQVGACVGGEGNGGVIVPAINACRDGLVALAVVVQAVSDSGQPLSRVAESLPRYIMLKDKIARGLKPWSQLKKALVRAFALMAPDMKAQKLKGSNVTDGLKLVGDGYWLHVRPSNTEPIIRIIAEARTEAVARGLIRKARKTIGGRG